MKKSISILSKLNFKITLAVLSVFLFGLISFAQPASKTFFQPYGLWTPLQVDQTNNIVSMWGRNYQFGTGSVLMTQITSVIQAGGTSQPVGLLASPGHIDAMVGSSYINWGPSTISYPTVTDTLVVVSIQADGTNISAHLDVKINIEFTGYTFISASVTGQTISKLQFIMPVDNWGLNGLQHYNYSTSYAWCETNYMDITANGFSTSQSACNHTVFDEKKGIGWFANTPINALLNKVSGKVNFAVDLGATASGSAGLIALPARPKALDYDAYQTRLAFESQKDFPTTQYLQAMADSGVMTYVAGISFATTFVHDSSGMVDFVKRAHSVGLKVLLNCWLWEAGNCPDVPWADVLAGKPYSCANAGNNVYVSRNKLKSWVKNYDIDGYYTDDSYPSSSGSIGATSTNGPVDYYKVLKEFYRSVHDPSRATTLNPYPGMAQPGLISDISGTNFSPVFDLWYDDSYCGEDWDMYQCNGDSPGPCPKPSWSIQTIWRKVTQFPGNTPREILSWNYPPPYNDRCGPADVTRGCWSLCYMMGTVSWLSIPNYDDYVTFLSKNSCNSINFTGYWETSALAKSTGDSMYCSGWLVKQGTKSVISVNNWYDGASSQNVTVTVSPTATGISAANMVIRDAETGKILKQNSNVITLAVNSHDFRMLEVTTNPLSVKNYSLENNLTVFPNPSQNNVTITMSLSGEENIILTIKNILGQTVYSETTIETNEYKKAIDLSKEGKGIYFVEVLSGNNRSNKKIVLQ